MSRWLAPCAACGRHVRTTEMSCPFCRRSPVFVAAVMSLAVGCGTPTQPVAPPRELPPQAADAARVPDAPADAPSPDAPPPDATVVVDAAPPLPPDAAVPQVKHKGKIVGRVFRADPDGPAYHDISLYLVSVADPSVNRYATTGPSVKGRYEITDVPPGTYKLHIADNTRDGDGVMDVVIKKDQTLKLDVNLNQIALRRRPPKPYGAPPARRRVV